jgi:hypothetical protein
VNTVDSFVVTGADLKAILSGTQPTPIPTPNPTPAPLTVTKYVTAEAGLLVRKTPGGEKIGSLTWKTPVQVKVVPTMNWYQLVFPGSAIDDGWVSGQYLSDTRP